jgi:hypothetical protein
LNCGRPLVCTRLTVGERLKEKFVYDFVAVWDKVDESRPVRPRLIMTSGPARAAGRPGRPQSEDLDIVRLQPDVVKSYCCQWC